MSVGDGAGNTTVIRLQHSLATTKRGERSSANDMFERSGNVLNLERIKFTTSPKVQNLPV